jgi:hypothetical protein
LKKISSFQFNESQLEGGMGGQEHRGYQGQGLFRPPEIAHPDALDLMWNGCVLVRFDGRLSPSQMKEDIDFDFKEFSLYRRKIYSFTGAAVLAAQISSLALLLILPALAGMYADAREKDTARHKKYRNLLFAGVFLAVLAFAAVFIGVGPKTRANELPRTDSAWIRVCYAMLNDLELDQPEAGTDLEPYFRKKISGLGWLEQAVNPFTGEPVKIGHGPGNFSIAIEGGKFVGFDLHWRDGYSQRIPVNEASVR